VLGAVQPLGTTSVSEPLFIPPAAAVYVNVMVFPVWLADTFVVGVVGVPAPSTASGGWSATRCATHGVDVEIVAVLLPVAPAVARVPSAPVAMALLAGELPEEIEYCWVSDWPAFCVRVGDGPDWPCAP